MLRLKLTGLRYHMLDFQDTPYAAHLYSRLTWAPDVTLSPQALAADSARRGWDKVQEIADLIAHKKPNATAVEASLVPQDSFSVWLEGLSAASTARKAFSAYTLLTNDATAVVAAQSRYEGKARTAFRLADIGKPPESGFEEPLKDADADLFILRLPSTHLEITAHIVENVRKLLRAGGHLLVIGQNGAWLEAESAESANPAAESHSTKSPDFPGFETVYALDCTTSPSLSYGQLAILRETETETGPNVLPLDVVHITKPGQICGSITEGLQARGWDVCGISAGITGTDVEQSLASIRQDATVIVLSELDAPRLPTLDPKQWVVIQQLLQRRNRIIWVSESAQWQVSNPNGAMIHGLCRSVRTEDPSARITTLDLESAREVPTAVSSIDRLLRAIQKPSSIKGTEGEYVERGGIFHVSRILGDDAINAAVRAGAGGADAVETRLHEAETTIRMIAERVGSIDSLHYVEVDGRELPLVDKTVEVELQASALNFKDVAVTMGIVPENHHLLGLEGAGTIRRVGARLRSPFHVGQRVLVFEKGTFANRIIATTERTIVIPDWLSFEEAATLPSVYLTALYSLFNLGSIKTGDRVLIHSATGGLGIASIQICQAVGAEVYATVGQPVKKQFLIDHFGIPAENIFHSRSTEFEAQLMHQTGGSGVDIILNSLTDDLLDASWRCIAEGGTMVELGKKDHIGRNTLAMEPFGRNASYRCFDMSYRHVTDQVIAVLMKQMMDMVMARVVKPIVPMKLFPYSDIPSAVRFMRSANHIGKIIISNKEHVTADPAVPVRPAPRSFRLRSDVSYLIVGGLRGLCGFLAVDLARHGARRVVVLGRNGYEDTRSQAVLKDLAAEGCQADLVRGDVACMDDVRRALQSAGKPVAGIIQGAMVLRDKPFETMSHDDYTTTIVSKVAGTWNLHNAALDLGLDLNSFTLLSSISGLIGQPAQANYAAANVFLDSFASYRRRLGLRANSVNLGAIEDVGYMAEHSSLISALDTSAWTPINESLFHSIAHFSIMQQQRPQQGGPLNSASCAQLITSIAVPQSPSSKLLSDARFSSLLFGYGSDGGGSATDSSGANKEIQALLLQIRSGADVATVLPAAVDVANSQFVTTLRLDEPLEPAKSLSAYGLDSLGAVEFRNWARARLGADLYQGVKKLA